MNNSSKTILRGTSIVGGLTAVSRVFGFLRDLAVASTFGASTIADIFFVAFRIPNLLRSFVAEGALTSAFVPVFSEEVEKSNEAARFGLRAVSGMLLQITILLAILGIIFSPEIIDLFGLPAEKSALGTLLLRIMFPYIIFVSLVAMFNGALNSVHVFGFNALAQIIMNIVLIAGALTAAWFDPETGITLLACSVTVSGVVQLFIFIRPLAKANLLVLPSMRSINKVTKQILLLMTPAIAGAAMYQIQVFLNSVLASYLMAGSISWLFYADRIAQLPIGIFSIALASVLLPTLSRAAASNNENAFSGQLADSLRFTSFLMIPTACGLAFLAHPIYETLFERGAFTAVDTHYTAAALTALSIGIWGVSCFSIVTRAFLARKDTVTPTIIGLITLIINISLGLILMGPAHGEGSLGDAVRSLQGILGSVFPLMNFGHVGLALASSIASILAFCVALLLVIKKNPLFSLRPFFAATLKAVIASAGMLAVLFLIDKYEMSAPVRLISCIPAGVVSYGFFSFLLKSTEIQATVKLFSRKA